MGQSQEKPQIIDANQAAKQSYQNSQNIEHFLKKAFLQASSNGRIYRDKFNEALSILESLNIRRIRDTPLGDRLFTVLDIDKSGYLSEDEYLNGITLLINDKEKRIMYSFKVYDKDDDGRVSRMEFYDFIKESWICGFRLLAELIQKGPNPYNVNLSKINAWAEYQIPELQKYVNVLFNQLDPKTTGFIDFQIFKQWVISGDGGCVRACFDNQEVNVALNLYKLENK